MDHIYVSRTLYYAVRHKIIFDCFYKCYGMINVGKGFTAQTITLIMWCLYFVEFVHIGVGIHFAQYQSFFIYK